MILMKVKIELDESDVWLLLKILNNTIEYGDIVEMMREYVRLHDYLKEFV